MKKNRFDNNMQSNKKNNIKLYEISILHQGIGEGWFSSNLCIHRGENQ